MTAILKKVKNSVQVLFSFKFWKKLKNEISKTWILFSSDIIFYLLAISLCTWKTLCFFHRNIIFHHSLLATLFDHIFRVFWRDRIKWEEFYAFPEVRWQWQYMLMQAWTSINILGVPILECWPERWGKEYLCPSSKWIGKHSRRNYVLVKQPEGLSASGLFSWGVRQRSSR